MLTKKELVITKEELEKENNKQSEIKNTGINFGFNGIYKGDYIGDNVTSLMAVLNKDKSYYIKLHVSEFIVNEDIKNDEGGHLLESSGVSRQIDRRS